MEIIIPAVVTFLVPVNIGLVAIVKQYIDSKWAGLLALFFGIVLVALVPNVGGVREVILDGLILGLSSAGLYSGTKAVLR